MLVRTDLPLADQIVQVGHACLEAGFRFRQPAEIFHLVVVGVESEAALLSAVEQLSLQGILFAVFHEPDDQMGFTAACSEPLRTIYRRAFRRFPLWSITREVKKS